MKVDLPDSPVPNQGIFKINLLWQYPDGVISLEVYTDVLIQNSICMDEKTAGHTALFEYMFAM